MRIEFGHPRRRASTLALLAALGLLVTAILLGLLSAAGPFVPVALPCTWLALAILARQALLRERATVAQARELYTAEARLDALLRASSGNSIIATDVSGTVTIWNAGAEAMLGWRADEVIGRPVPFVHDRDEFLGRAAELGVAPGPDVFRRPLESADADVRHWTYVRKDGSRLTVTLSVTAVRDIAGEIVGYVGIGTDVSVVHDALHRLNTQKQMHELLLARLPGTIVAIVDDQLRYVSLNGAALPLGLRHEDLVGRPVGAAVDDENALIGRELYAAALETSSSVEAGIGGRHWEIDAVPLVGPGGRRFAMSVARDVTTRRATELALLDALDHQRAAARALEELDRMRTEVMANISHELRTPLTLIRGHLELMADGDAGELNSEQLEMVEAMTRNSNRLRALIDDLIVLARMDQADATVAGAGVVDLSALARASAHDIRTTLLPRGQQLHADVSGEQVWVAGDADQLERAVQNLLSNASKFSAPGTTIGLSLAVHGDRVEISVADHGRGIPPEELEYVFERFYRGADSEVEGIKGTGLGLAMVRTIIDRHGGTVAVDSRVGRGSSFTISLPMIAGQQQAA